MLLVAALLTAFMASRLGSLRFDYDFEAFFPNEDSELELYNSYRETFEYDNEFVLVAPENKAGIFRQHFLLRLDSLTRALAKLPHVREVQSPTTLKRIVLDGLVPVSYPLLHFRDSARYAADSARIYSNKALVGSFFPSNARSATIFVKTEKGLTKRQCDTVASSMRRALAQFHFDDIHVAGRIFAQEVYLDQLRKEFVIFISIAFALVTIFLWLTFRNWYGIVLPLVVVLTAILWTLGLMSLLGKPIDLMTTMLPTMIFIAGMSDVVHFFSKYFECRARDVPREKIYPLILKEVGFPTFLTLLTTVVAFLSLLFSDMRPVREFGIYTAVGISIAFILTYTLLPALLSLMKPVQLQIPTAPSRLEGLMRGGMLWTLRRQRGIFIFALFAVAISSIGLSRIRVNNILLEDLDDSVRIKQDFMFFDKFYSGVRPFEMEVTVRDKQTTILDYTNMKALHRIDSFIRVRYRPGFLVSPAVIARELYVSRTGDSAQAFPAESDYNDILSLLKASRKNREFRRFMRPDGRRGRISGKIRDLGSSQVAAMNIELKEFIRTTPEAAGLSFEITGAAHLIDRNNEYMVKNMMQGFLFSVVVIGLLTFLLHRSWRMVLVFIIPNLVPLLIIAGIMGFAGIELKAATSIIFSIAFGIATDDTIHFISRLRIERAYGKSMLYAFKRTYLETGRPIVLTTFILLGGFMSLMTSSFQSTFYFGLLTCVTVVVALLADLFLLPVLLLLLYRKTDHEQPAAIPEKFEIGPAKDKR